MVDHGSGRVLPSYPLAEPVFWVPGVPTSQPGDLPLESVFMHSWDSLERCKLEAFESAKRRWALIISYKASASLALSAYRSDD